MKFIFIGTQRQVAGMYNIFSKGTRFLGISLNTLPINLDDDKYRTRQRCR